MEQDDRGLRPQPHNIEAEQALIGAALVNNDVVDHVRAHVTWEHFFDPLHKRLWMAIERRVTAGRAASPVLLKPLFEKDPGMASIGGPAYLARLAGAAISIFNAKDYATSIRELWVRRQLFDLIEEAEAAVDDPEADVETAISSLEGRMIMMAEVAQPEDQSTAARAAVEMVDDINAAWMEGVDPGLSFGLHEVDRYTGGMLPADVCVLAGRTSMGKTAKALHVMRRQLKDNVGVFVASLEMKPKALAMRVISAMLYEQKERIEYRKMRRPNDLDEAEFKRIIECAQEMAKLPLRIMGPESTELGRIVSEARIAKRAFDQMEGCSGLGLIIVDYVQLVTVPGAESGADQISKAMKGLKRLAAQLEVPILILAQLNREVENRATAQQSIPRPRMSDLKGSGSIEEDADIIILIHRDEYYVNEWKVPAHIKGKEARAKARQELEEMKIEVRGKIDIIIGKNRQGERADVKAKGDLGVNIIEDLNTAPAIEPEVQEELADL